MKLTKQQKVILLEAVRDGEITSPSDFARSLGLTDTPEPIIINPLNGDGWSGLTPQQFQEFITTIAIPKNELLEIGKNIIRFAEGITEDRRKFKRGTPSERGEL